MHLILTVYFLDGPFLLDKDLVFGFLRILFVVWTLAAILCAGVALDADLVSLGENAFLGVDFFFVCLLAMLDFLVLLLLGPFEVEDPGCFP